MKTFFNVFIWQVCKPCDTSYDAIIKSETLDQDTEWFFEKLKIFNLTEEWNEDLVYDKNYISTEKYFSQLSKENVYRLYQKYQIDFEMFNYENQVQRYIDMGS